MSDILDLANKALMRAAMDGFKIEVFLVEKAEWDKIADHHTVPIVTGDEECKLMDVPVECFPNLMQCVERSCGLAMKGRVGWILNPDPFRKIEMKPAFDAESFDDDSRE